MGKYLKMAGVFNPCEVVETDVKVLYAVSEEFDDGVTPHEYAHHAIQYHDELVAEVERLRAVISQIKSPTNDDCMKFLCTAFRHCDYEIKGDFEIDDMKPAFILYANSKGA